MEVEITQTTVHKKVTKVTKKELTEPMEITVRKRLDKFCLIVYGNFYVKTPPCYRMSNPDLSVRSSAFIA